MPNQEQKQSRNNEAQQYRTNEQQQVQPAAAGNRDFVFQFAKQPEVVKKLRTPRSRAYMEALAAVDMLSTTDEEIIEKLKSQMDEETAEEFSEMSTAELMEEIMASIQEELRDALEEMSTNHLECILSKCYIPGCDVHAIDRNGMILDHYDANVPLPGRFARGRALMHQYTDCKYVEVYTSFCLVVQDDASVVQVDG